MVLATTDTTADAATAHSALDYALQAFGTAAIFERRAIRTARKLRVLMFLGLAVPVTIGGLVAAFGAHFAALETLLVIGGLVAACQAIWSLWAIVAGWDSILAYSRESHTDNIGLYKRFLDLAQSNGATDIEVRLRVLEAENNAREVQDQQRDIGDDEKRFGMRSALRQLRRACVACKQVPTSMEASQCGVCGRF